MENTTATSPAHTPGPWHLYREGDYDLVRDDHDRWVTKVLINRDADFDPEEAEANARIIAAAPDLLRQLEHLLFDLEGAKELMLSGTESDSWMVTDDGWDQLIQSTKKVIDTAKAK